MSAAYPLVEMQVTICNMRGLHARAAAKFVKLAETFTADIVVVRADMRVPATSIMGLMMLGAAMGSDIVISASGVDADVALAALRDLVERKFDEAE